MLYMAHARMMYNIEGTMLRFTLTHIPVYFRVHSVLGLNPTHTTGRDLAMRRYFLVFTSRQICSLDNFIENFITFRLLDSSTFISALFVLKNEKSRRVAKSRSVVRVYSE